MTIETIISELLEELERPDLAVKTEKFVPEALRFAHSIRKFSKDLKDIIVVDPEITEEDRVSLSITTDLPKMRAINSIELYQGYTEPTTDLFLPNNKIPRPTEFKNRAELNSVYDYYGFKHRYIYTVVGREVVLEGVDQQTKAMRFRCFVWPAITRDDVTQKLTTDSWIVDDWPEIIKAKLRDKLTYVIDKKDFKQSAQQDLKIAMEDILAENHEGMY